MTTLYDLLGALPGDDADDLRDAFRRAVKDVHPDIRPNDPDAALNFRLIVYAMEVLRDPELRAAYDYLLDAARQELVSQRRTAKIRTFAFAMLGLAGLSVAVVGASSLFAPTLLPRSAQIDERSNGSADSASGGVPGGPASSNESAKADRDKAPTQPAEERDDFVTRWGRNDIDAKPDPKAGAETGTGPPAEKQDDLRPPSDANDKSPSAARDAETATVTKQQESPIVRPSGPTPPVRRDDADDVPSRLEPDDKADPSAVMQAKAIAAYRNGDLNAALADLSRAIELNPTFALAYINRGIVLYRMGKLDLALADVARARRIDRAGRSAATVPAHRKRRRDKSAIEIPALIQAARS